MSRVRTVTVSAVAWCVVVAVVATLVWVVIARAGAGLSPTGEPRADSTGSLPAAQHRGSHHRGHATPSPSRTTAPGSPGTPQSSASSAPTSPSTGPAVARSSTPPPPASSHSAPPPTAQRRSWSGDPGHVVAECRATSVRLISAYPNTGWQYQILSRGPGAVAVRFRHLSGDDRLTLRARCVAGTPHFSTSDGGGGGDD